MPWPVYLEILDYWQNNPPLHKMVAGFLGVGKKRNSFIDEIANKHGLELSDGNR